MQLKQTGTLAPKDEPWTLIRDAISDLELQEVTEGIRIHMDDWHTGVYDLCAQCLAGCVMSRRLSADTDWNYTPSSFNGEDRCRLNALESFRTGNLKEAYFELEVTFPTGPGYLLPDNVYIPSYDHEPGHFKSELLWLADLLEDVSSRESFLSGN